MVPIYSFLIFAFTALITPGPNNLMVMHSGLNFGIKRSLRHFCGILFGVAILLFIIAIGFGFVFERVPWLKLVIKIIGSLYMLFLAWKISQMNEKKTDTNVSSPLTFLAAALFQWVNPKAWVICIAFTSMFSVSSHYFINAFFLVLIITLINSPCLMLWMGFGRVLEKIINNSRQRKILNRILGLFLAASVILLWK